MNHKEELLEREVTEGSIILEGSEDREWEVKHHKMKREAGGLAGSVAGAGDSCSCGYEFKPHIGCRPYLKINK